MRLWSLHPKYLDLKGLVAVWREALLAKAVLENRTKGYKKHPQLKRFKESHDPIAAINAYLYYIWEEAHRRGYNFNKRKIGKPLIKEKVPVNRSQVEYELKHLNNKLKLRGQKNQLKVFHDLELHPLFFIENLH